MIAHELTHGWWGGIIPVSHDSLYKGQWNETLAEYTSSWILETDEAYQLRKKWSQNYASIEDGSDISILEIGSYSAHWKINEAITYHKGALLMALLEDRVGLVSIKKVLNLFIEKRTGKPSSWEHFLDELKKHCGKETSDWFREWLSNRSAPSFTLRDIIYTDETLSGKLLQSNDPLFEGQVEIGFYKDNRVLGLDLVQFEKNVTLFELRVPIGTNKIFLDPRYRIPRRYNLDTGQML